VHTTRGLIILSDRAKPTVTQPLALIDPVIDEPFVIALYDGASEWRGSRNQRLIRAPLRRHMTETTRR